MSVHSMKSKRRYPDAPRERYEVGHITIEVSHQEGTFALIAGQAVHAKDRRALFSGNVERGMGTALRRVAHVFDDIEASLARKAKE